MLDEEIHVYTAASVKVPYDLRFLPSVLDWAMQVSELSGGDSKENDNLRLALEETLTFVITAYPDAEQWEQVRVDFSLLTSGFVELTIANAGPPVHISRIPSYDPNAPEDSMDGLWYFLARSVVDDLEFMNLGTDGWRVVIRKLLASPLIVTPAEEIETASGVKAKLSVRYAVPDDASELMDLTYATYRYSYVGDTFYHESKLREALQSGELVSMLVESGDQIVGNYSMFIPEESPRCGYMSSLMVQPEFRKTRAIMYLLKEIVRYIVKNPRGLDLFYSTMVTAHAGSQKAGAKVGSSPLALLLNMGVGENFRGIKSIEGQPDNYALYARLAKEPTMEALYVPERHHAVMRPLLDQVGCLVNLVAAEALPEGETELSTQVYQQMKTAAVKVERLGSDFVACFRRTLFDLHADGIRGVMVLISATEPLPPELDQEMAQLNGVFTGIKPFSCSKYYNVYSMLFNRVDFEAIKLADPMALDLKEHIHGLYREIFGETDGDTSAK